VRQMSRISYVELLMGGDPRSVFRAPNKTGKGRRCCHHLRTGGGACSRPKRCLTRIPLLHPQRFGLDTSPLRCRVIPLSRTLLPFSSQWFD
jgi:hypothetical protein